MHKHVYSKELTTWECNSPQHRRWGKNVNIIDQGITHHTKFNPDYMQTSSCKGNLPSESATVHRTASGERRNCDCYPWSYHSSPKIQSWCMNKYVHSRQLTTWVWVNAPVHSTASWQKRKMWSLLTKLSLITQNSIPRIHKHIHSKKLTNWECNSPQYSKWGKEKKLWLLS